MVYSFHSMFFLKKLFWFFLSVGLKVLVNRKVTTKGEKEKGKKNEFLWFKIWQVPSFDLKLSVIFSGLIKTTKKSKKRSVRPYGEQILCKN